jgi:hypothetical protein
MGGDLYDRDDIDATHRCRNQWRSNRGVGEVMEIARLRRTGGAGEGDGTFGFGGMSQKKDPCHPLARAGRPDRDDGGLVRMGEASATSRPRWQMRVLAPVPQSALTPLVYSLFEGMAISSDIVG